jgi:hypothetical protein
MQGIKNSLQSRIQIESDGFGNHEFFDHVVCTGRRG